MFCLYLEQFFCLHEISSMYRHVGSKEKKIPQMNNSRVEIKHNILECLMSGIPKPGIATQFRLYDLQIF